VETLSARVASRQKPARYHVRRSFPNVLKQRKGTKFLTVSGVLIHAALSGAGVAYLLKEQVAEYLEDGRLIELLPLYSVPHEACYLYYPDRRQIRPAMRAVIDILKEGGTRSEPTANGS
jgi:DNA-binding transcriptional LysR family regulator